MIYLGLLEEDCWRLLSVGEGGEVIGTVFCDAGKEGIGEFGVVDDDWGVDGMNYEGLAKP